MLQAVDGSVKHLALNDCAISRGGYARLIGVTVQVNGQKAGFYRGDGLVVSTPTGATGYSLSAGGPLVMPDVDCILITPICAHSMQNRPMVVPGNAEIILHLQPDSEVTASLQIDGQTAGLLHSGDTVTIAKARKAVKLIRLG